LFKPIVANTFEAIQSSGLFILKNANPGRYILKNRNKNHIRGRRADFTRQSVIHKISELKAKTNALLQNPDLWHTS